MSSRIIQLGRGTTKKRDWGGSGTYHRWFIASSLSKLNLFDSAHMPLFARAEPLPPNPLKSPTPPHPMDTHEGTPPFFMHDSANICSIAIVIRRFLIFIMITDVKIVCVPYHASIKELVADYWCSCSWYNENNENCNNDHTSYLSYVLHSHFFRQFYTEKCINLRQKRPRDKTA